MMQRIMKPSLVCLALGLAACNGDYAGSAAETPPAAEVKAPYGTLNLERTTGSDVFAFDTATKSYSLTGLVLKAGEALPVQIKNADGKFCAFNGELAVDQVVALNCSADAAAGTISAVTAGSYKLLLNAVDSAKPLLALSLITEDTAAPFGVVSLKIDSGTTRTVAYDSTTRKYLAEDLLLSASAAKASIQRENSRYCGLSGELADGAVLNVSWQDEVVEPALKLTQSGLYSFEIDATNSVHAKAGIKLIEANQAPVAKWQELAVTPAGPGKVLFDATASTDDNDWDQDQLKASWDFGDGTKIEDKPLSEQVGHSYKTPGTYQLTLTVIDRFGAQSTETKQLVFSSAAPVADFSFSPDGAEAPASVSFDASASSDDQGIESYSWDFGDGNSGSGQKVTHSYPKAGSYQAKLTVSDADAQKTELMKVVTVQNAADKLPVASFSVGGAGAPAPVTLTFDASDSTDDNGIKGYSWAFGDGQTGVGKVVTHAYSVGGSFTVALTVTDTADQTHISTQTLNIKAANKPPVAGIKVTPASASVGLNTNVTFESTSTDSDGSIASSAWLIDGKSYNTAKVEVKFTKAGVVNASLTVTDNQNATAATQYSLTVVNQAPVAKFSVAPVAPKTAENVTFTSESSDSDGSIASYLWTFSDGQTFTTANLSRQFATAGSYTVKLKVTDDQGDSHESQQTLNVAASSSGDAVNGKIVFERATGGLSCGTAGACHGASPASNTNKIMNGVTFAAIDKAFNEGLSSALMGGIRKNYTDQELHDVAAYIATFK